jgi:hypothetical protein
MARARRRVVGCASAPAPSSWAAPPTSDFVVVDPRVSRRHCSLVLEADGVRVKDLGSRNGTRINGVACGEALVRPGGVIEVGDTTLLLDGEDLPVDVDGDASLGGLSAGGAALRRVFSVLSRAARSDVTVLLLGESGVGKDVVARALHRESPRSRGPFVVVDCGAIAPGLVGSELFGHKKGAFTSASEDRVGAFEAARGGTLLLDELGELPLELQPTLLRVLESRTVTASARARPAPSTSASSPPPTGTSRPPPPPAASGSTSTTASRSSPSPFRRCAIGATRSCPSRPPSSPPPAAPCRTSSPPTAPASSSTASPAISAS